jgi:hypothetical protein
LPEVWIESLRSLSRIYRDKNRITGRGADIHRGAGTGELDEAA